MEYDFSILESDRLKLRKLEISDASEVYENWASSDKVTKYLTWKKHEDIYETEKILKMWEDAYDSGMNYRWGIVIKDSDELIGMIDTVNLDLENRIAYLGYVLSEEYWGRGITTEAVNLVLEYLFNDEGFLIIKARHNIDNPASGEVMKKAGMRFESITKDGMMYSDGSKFDIIRYSITKKEWLRRFCRKRMK